MAEALKLPARPHPDHLRKQARQLLRELRASGSTVRLADAQHTLARQYGFPRWQALIDFVASTSAAPDAPPRDRPLYRAANAGDLNRLDELLRHVGFDPADLSLALGRACLRAPYLPTWRQTAERLVAAGADAAGEYGDSYGPILLGCGETISYDGALFLLDHGADALGDESRPTKYPDSNTPMRMTLGCYLRERWEEKHRLIDLLLERGSRKPSEVSDAAFAVFRGDLTALDDAIAADPPALARRFGRFPYGNILLHGATPLHLAVEFGEVGAVQRLIALGADLNAPAEVLNRVGGQTPVFHAICSHNQGCRPVLRWLLDHHADSIDWTVAASFTRYDGVKGPFTPLEWAKQDPDGVETKWIQEATSRP